MIKLHAVGLSLSDKDDKSRIVFHAQKKSLALDYFKIIHFMHTLWLGCEVFKKGIPN